MEDSSTTTATLDLYRALRAEGHDNVGIVLQAMLRRTLDDVLDLVALRPNVRVCKGIYVEPAEIAYQGDEAIRFAFVEAMTALWEGGAKVAVATHDEWLVAEALRLIQERSLGPERYEFQMLLGVREALADELVARRAHPARLRALRPGLVRVLAPAPPGEPQGRRLRRSRHPPAPEAVNGLSWRFVTIVGLFVTSLVVSNIIAVKLAEVGGRVFDAGNVLFPLAYVLGDVLTEVYGFRAARRVILLGFACNVLAVGAIQIALRLPAADFWLENQEAYETVLGTTWRIFVASLIAYLVGELTNSYVLSRMKVATGGRFLWTRTIGSSLVGQGLDSALFVTIAFAGTGAPLLDTIVTTWVIKVAWEALATPITYLVTNWLKRSEGVDVFDMPRAAEART